MDSNPTNTEAMILYVRVGLAKGSPAEVLHTVLDKGLVIEPENARLNFWKGRLFGPAPPWDGSNQASYEFVDFEKATEYLGKAVKLDPENNTFRETLGAYYAIKRMYEDARIYTKHIDNGQLHLYNLLKDIQSIPIPREAIFLPSETLRMISLMKEKGLFDNYYNLRVHVYSFPLSAVATSLFYEERLTGFEFFETERDKKAKTVKLKQYLKSWEMELYSSNNLQEIPVDPEEGITIDVESFYRKNSISDPLWVSETLKISPSLDARKLFCKLVLVNYRKSD